MTGKSETRPESEPTTPIVGVTAGSSFDLRIERDVFEGIDVQFMPVDIETTEDLISAFGDVDAVIDRLLSAPYTREVIDSLGPCKVIARAGIGVDSIDTERAAERGIYVVNVPTYCQNEVSEHTLLLILALQRKLPQYDTALKDGVWARDVETPSVHRLRGQTLGLVGYGTIARLVAEKAAAFGMDIVVTDPYVDATTIEDDGAQKASAEEVLGCADVVSLHAPLVAETEDMIDRDALARMKDSAYLINVARGGLVVEEALLEALDRGDIAGAGLDVFRHEPSGQSSESPPFENPLQKFDNVILTPHVAWFSQEANNKRRRTAAQDVRRVLTGEHPENPMNNPG